MRKRITYSAKVFNNLKSRGITISNNNGRIRVDSLKYNSCSVIKKPISL